MLDGFQNAGEVLKRNIPDWITSSPTEVAVAMRHELEALEMYPGVTTSVIHSPELVFLIDALLKIDQGAVVIHLIRDGRDVACSLLEQGWLNSVKFSRKKALRRLGSADWEYLEGQTPRFWTEPHMKRDFRRASNARRAAWAWRRHVEAGIQHGPSPQYVTVRYEELIAHQPRQIETLRTILGQDAEQVALCLSEAHDRKVSRWRNDLTSTQLSAVISEAGDLLGKLGYLMNSGGDSKSLTLHNPST